MRLTVRYDADDWRRLTFENEDDWRVAVEIFSGRIHERFLDPIERMEKLDYAGFAVIALDCLLIEMLQQFYEGVHRTPKGLSKLYFVNFLTDTGFGNHFDRKMATTFYRQIRCGILHQAEIRGSSKILIDKKLPLVSFADDQSGLIVNRLLFHRQLLEEFENYKNSLLNTKNDDLRQHFHKKMRYICKHACEVI